MVCFLLNRHKKLFLENEATLAEVRVYLGPSCMASAVKVINTSFQNSIWMIGILYRQAGGKGGETGIVTSLLVSVFLGFLKIYGSSNVLTLDFEIVLLIVLLPYHISSSLDAPQRTIPSKSTLPTLKTALYFSDKSNH